MHLPYDIHVLIYYSKLSWSAFIMWHSCVGILFKSFLKCIWDVTFMCWSIIQSFVFFISSFQVFNFMLDKYFHLYLNILSHAYYASMSLITFFFLNFCQRQSSKLIHSFQGQKHVIHYFCNFNIKILSNFKKKRYTLNK